ncbi:MAG: FkbM family methyltransferase [Solirubrobacteraceae bacterium]
MKGNRSWRAVVRAPLQRGHYRALLGMARRYPRFWANLYRFLTARGAYPYSCRVRTPSGEVSVRLHSSHDLSTVNEIFCREDYAAPHGLRVAVDVGANIGIASLYFLTRNTSSRVYAFEPNPANIARLRENLAGYEERYVLHECAIGLRRGPVAFEVEPTGRYGSIAAPDGGESTGKASGGVLTVECEEINAVVREILAQEGEIDILKVDTEGMEAELVASLEPGLLDAIALICYETNASAPRHLDRYRHSYSTQTNRLERIRRAPDRG